MNLSKTHLRKYIKIFLSSVIFLLLFIVIQHTIAPNKVFAGEEGRGCTYDNGETPWLGHACSSEAPFCIDGHCQVKQNDPPGVCGEDEDCTGSNFCEGGTCKSQNDCGLLNQNQCNSRTSQCFWYRGGRGDNARCVANQNKGMNCYDGACYSDQQCHRNAMKTDGSTVGFCGNGDLHLNEPCDYSSSQNECASSENLSCQGGFCKVDSTIPSTTPPPSTKTDFCRSLNPAGTYSDYVCRTSCNSDEEILNSGSYCDGSGPGYICCKKKTAPIPSATPPPATTTPGPSGGGSGTCETEDNRPLGAGVSLADKTFHCKASCTSGTEEDKTGQGALYVCTGTLRCCKDIAKYSQYYGSSIGNGTTPAPGGGTTSPGGGTSTPGGGTPGPASGPCAGVKGGVLSYVNGTCNEKLFDATKAAAREFCGGVYKDKYICQNIDPSTSQRYVDYIPSGGNTCSSPPWCPAAGGTTTPSPTVGPDANCTAYQGQTCHPGDYSNKIYCCQPNKNLECTNPNPAFPSSYTCQYKGGVAFTPTPGASSNCSAANFGNWGVGCACPTGGGCQSGIRCMREASGKVFPPDNPNGQFCATGLWCSQSQTDVDNAAACLGSTPYVSPSPTGSSGSGYQADCPYYNAAGGLTNNECQDGTQCLAGYDHAPIGPGGTNGDRVCSETNGRPNVCCTKRPGGSTTTTPAPGGGTTAPAPSTTTAPAPTSSYTPPSSCVGHPANSMCGSASEANMQCFYPGGTGYWGWKGEGNGCDLGSGTQTNCYVCTP